ncbi:MAG: pyridoxamine 5'-phosphate oxidase family protein [Bacilli bacterium]|jgi:nitroimidazol reductase NimA-like FMN-containing flavoprotein (pyridoxamine 5'-phosphate oxidase superfamily)|nr:pyridoxamine 5'-phosphate oxidase family protein [Bacilli bacterium]
MTYPLRRARQALSEAQCEALLREGLFGVLSLADGEDYPYGVPLSYVYQDKTLYFHCALSGHKLSCIAKNSKACFTVVLKDEIHPEHFTTYFESVMAFGKVSVVTDETKRKEMLTAIGPKYGPQDGQGLDQEVSSSLERVTLLSFTIDVLTGKQAIELVKNQ